jgi:hypothetical protein
MNQVQVEHKSYQMPPKDGITVAHFLTIADIERSLRFYEHQVQGRHQRRARLHRDREHVAHCQRRNHR